jgi:hypothetical protein
MHALALVNCNTMQYFRAAPKGTCMDVALVPWLSQVLEHLIPSVQVGAD